MNIRVYCFCLMAIIAETTQAETQYEFNCAIDGQVLENQYQSGFDDIRALAIETNTKLCQAMLALAGERGSQVQNTLLEFADAARRNFFTSFTDNGFAEAGKQFDYFENTVVKPAITLESLSLDALSVGPDNDFNTEIFFNTQAIGQRTTIPAALNNQCANVVGSSNQYSGCMPALQDFARGFNAYRHAYDQYRFGENEVRLNALSSQWDDFLENGRTQTILDIWFTTWMHRDYYAQDKLVSPAATQYFLLRPQVVFEYLKDADKGSRDELGLAVEWIGINWWNTKFPVGVSAISVYTDRANEKSVGNGLLFTFDNKYSVGWTRRDDDNGVFVTLNILDLFQDKREKLAQYKSMF